MSVSVLSFVQAKAVAQEQGLGLEKQDIAEIVCIAAEVKKHVSCFDQGLLSYRCSSSELEPQTPGSAVFSCINSVFEAALLFCSRLLVSV